MNAADVIARHGREISDQPALRCEGRTITYSALELTASRVAQGLSRSGVGRGDRVAIVLPNVPEFVVAYLATLQLGAIAVSLNSSLKPQALGAMLQDCSPRAVFSTPDAAAAVAKANPMENPVVIAVEGIWEGAIPYDRLANTPDCIQSVADMNADDPAAILYSSGTMGFPKGVTLSHRNVLFNSEAKVRYCGIGLADRLLLFLPLFHVFGQNAVMNAGLHAGATIVLHRNFQLDPILASIRQEQVTMFFAVPTVYTLLLERGSPDALASVRYWFSAAAPMPPDVVRRWRARFGRPIYEGYGLSETSPFACYNHETRYKPGSVGTPIRGVEIAIVDPSDGKRLPAGRTGEIIVRGPNVMLGYWNHEEETREAIRDGWFHTGDLGQMDDEGYVFILDRLKDMIDVAGKKVWPSDVENILLGHPSVREAAVFGRPDPVTGERTVAHVVLEDGSSSSVFELQAWCRRQLADYQVPTEIEVVDQLPRNAAGKILRRILREGPD